MHEHSSLKDTTSTWFRLCTTKIGSTYASLQDPSQHFNLAGSYAMAKLCDLVAKPGWVVGQTAAAKPFSPSDIKVPLRS